MEENRIQMEFLNLAKFLSKEVVLSGIEIDIGKEELCKIIVEYAKQYTLKDLKELLQIFHKIQNHQNSDLKLECQTAHCIECYYFFYYQNEFFTKDSCFCTCKKKIVPSYKSKIRANYIRLQDLKVTCVVCNKTKDKMRFTVINIHKCKVCSDCIRNKYVYKKGEKNYCRVCSEQYNDESELLCRTLHEETEEKSVVVAFHAENCERCGIEKDSRNFLVVCSDRHLACKVCTEERRKQGIETCWCGLQISVIQ